MSTEDKHQQPNDGKVNALVLSRPRGQYRRSRFGVKSHVFAMFWPCGGGETNEAVRGLAVYGHNLISLSIALRICQQPQLSSGFIQLIEDGLEVSEDLR